jgi:TolB protein
MPGRPEGDLEVLIVALMLAAGLAGAPVPGAAVSNPVPNPVPNPDWDAEWPQRESWCLSGHVQLTSETEFAKAGESYFSPDGNMIIFQGTPRPEGDAPEDRHYGMYTAAVIRSASGEFIGLGPRTLLSEPGSANTCGWFHPTDFSERHYRVLFGSTVAPPNEDAASGYQRGTSRYTWQFPNEMEVLAGNILMADRAVRIKTELKVDGQVVRRTEDEAEDVFALAGEFAPIWTRDGYDAEASWSPDGRHVLYTRLKPGSDDGDLWVYDTVTETHTELIAEPGYDGGPFFSPCGSRICYRSDRRGDKALQLYISELAFDETGKVTGIAREIPITDNEHVNWAPFFTPDGSMLFYASSEVSHSNYEVFAVDITTDRPAAGRATVRITDARGFDGLPVFTPDGTWTMWTAQRGALVAGEMRPSSQLWAARVDLAAVRARLDETQRAMDAAQRERELEEGFQEFMPGG